MTVYLVGAGPGAADLLTVRASKLLEAAEVVVYDRLVSPEILALVPDSAVMIDVGKIPGESQKQEDINKTLVEYGQTGGTVIRLKGGDPFVFGRGGEEALALALAGVECVVVPGISSALGVPAVAGVPVTHRGIATSFTVVTGHRMAGEPDVDWHSLGRAGGTIVVLMGVTRRAEIALSLIAAGRAQDEPVAIIQRGTRVDEHSFTSTLAELGAADVEPPAILVIGPVAGLNLFAQL